MRLASYTISSVQFYKVCCRKFYLRLPYKTIDEKFLPKKEKITRTRWSFPRTDRFVSGYLGVPDIKNPTTLLSVGLNHYGQCGFVNSKFDVEEINPVHELDRAQGITYYIYKRTVY